LLLHRSGEAYPVSFLRLQPRDVDKMFKKDGWSGGFNWGSYFQYPKVELYKMVIAGTGDIQGVIAMECMEGYIEVHLVESELIRVYLI
jgi:predicted RNA binding protein YcfA (HicA-like mRNA interferase family)